MQELKPDFTMMKLGLTSNRNNDKARRPAADRAACVSRGHKSRFCGREPAQSLDATNTQNGVRTPSFGKHITCDASGPRRVWPAEHARRGRALTPRKWLQLIKFNQSGAAAPRPPSAARAPATYAHLFGYVRPITPDNRISL
ncbi:hypothetical protein EVAR_26650_1 [Eumeta japonica]|uniref:Uncharacterized protein n=1 Tax=Eumeta variegata TaxID=151549 RepID=A0A4C1VKD7_EUMVA|nr:hypothetical protein EVAR_26650_1 [Eumeta japonica]